MNRTLIRAFWRERFTSPVRVVLLISFWLFALAISFTRKSAPLPEASWSIYTVMILGAGVIGRDVSTGVLQLILARPVGRFEYVFSRWLGLGTAAFGVGLLGWLIVLPLSLTRGTLPLPALGTLTEHLSVAFGMAAVITAFSALLPGMGDLALLAMGLILDMTLGMYGQFAKLPWLRRLADEFLNTLLPHVSMKDLTVQGAPHFYPVVTWISTVTLALLLAIVAMNRRELSYATAG